MEQRSDDETQEKNEHDDEVIVEGVSSYAPLVYHVLFVRPGEHNWDDLLDDCKYNFAIILNTA
jgi:hypothetical protein